MKKFLIGLILMLMISTVCSASIIQIRRDTNTNWFNVNPILAQGEWGLDTTNNAVKFGDGINTWNSLEYYSTVGNIGLYLQKTDFNGYFDTRFIAKNISLLTNDSNYQTYANVLNLLNPYALIGANISSFVNDSNYQTYANILNFDYLTNIVGLNNSDLINDSGYITVSEADANYYPITNPSGYITSYSDTNCLETNSCATLVYWQDANSVFLKQADANEWFVLQEDFNNLGDARYYQKTDFNYLNFITSSDLSDYLTENDANNLYAFKTDLKDWVVWEDANNTFYKQTDFNYLNFLTTINGLNISELNNDLNFQTYQNVLGFGFLTSNQDVDLGIYDLNTTGTLKGEHLQTTDDLEVADDIIINSGLLSIEPSGSYSDGGYYINKGTGKMGGLVTELYGQILSLGHNVPQVGTRNNNVTGGIFRFDMRGGNCYNCFVIYSYPKANGDDRDGTSAMEAFKINLETGDTYINHKSELGGTTIIGEYSHCNPTPDAQLTVNGDISLYQDGDKLLLGAGQDASFYYDNTNLIVNPKEVGSGLVYVDGNISAVDFITRTSIYDKTKGNALDKIKDSSLLVNDKGKIKHNEFYGYTQFEETDYSKPVIVINDVNECDDEGLNCKIVKKETITYPYKKIGEGVSLGDEIELLRQALVEQKLINSGLEDEISLLKFELCKKDSSYSWCKFGVK
jgi:hypothetical protein